MNRRQFFTSLAAVIGRAAIPGLAGGTVASIVVADALHDCPPTPREPYLKGDLVLSDDPRILGWHYDGEQWQPFTFDFETCRFTDCQVLDHEL